MSSSDKISVSKKGVSNKDPYEEFEMYLEKAQEEIKQVFDGLVVKEKRPPPVPVRKNLPASLRSRLGLIKSTLLTPPTSPSSDHLCRGQIGSNGVVVAGPEVEVASCNNCESESGNETEPQSKCKSHTRGSSSSSSSPTKGINILTTLEAALHNISENSQSSKQCLYLKAYELEREHCDNNDSSPVSFAPTNSGSRTAGEFFGVAEKIRKFSESLCVLESGNPSQSHRRSHSTSGELKTESKYCESAATQPDGEIFKINDEKMYDRKSKRPIDQQTIPQTLDNLNSNTNINNDNKNKNDEKLLFDDRDQAASAHSPPELVPENSTCSGKGEHASEIDRPAGNNLTSGYGSSEKVKKNSNVDFQTIPNATEPSGFGETSTSPNPTSNPTKHGQVISISNPDGSSSTMPVSVDMMCVKTRIAAAPLRRFCYSEIDPGNDGRGTFLRGRGSSSSTSSTSSDHNLSWDANIVGVDVNALSAWVESLAQEMNNISDEEGGSSKASNDRVTSQSKRNSQALVHWLLTDFQHVSSACSSSADKVTCSGSDSKLGEIDGDVKMPRDDDDVIENVRLTAGCPDFMGDSSPAVAMGACLSCGPSSALEDEEDCKCRSSSSRAVPIMAGSGGSNDTKYDPFVRDSRKFHSALSPLLNGRKCAHNAELESDSDSEVFEDALDYPVPTSGHSASCRSTRQPAVDIVVCNDDSYDDHHFEDGGGLNARAKKQQRETTKVKLKIDAPVSIQVSFQGRPKTPSQLTVKYSTSSESNFHGNSQIVELYDHGEYAFGNWENLDLNKPSSNNNDGSLIQTSLVTAALTGGVDGPTTDRVSSPSTSVGAAHELMQIKSGEDEDVAFESSPSVAQQFSRLQVGGGDNGVGLTAVDNTEKNNPSADVQESNTSIDELMSAVDGNDEGSTETGRGMLGEVQRKYERFEEVDDKEKSATAGELGWSNAKIETVSPNSSVIDDKCSEIDDNKGGGGYVIAIVENSTEKNNPSLDIQGRREVDSITEAIGPARNLKNMSFSGDGNGSGEPAIETDLGDKDPQQLSEAFTLTKEYPCITREGSVSRWENLSNSSMEGQRSTSAASSGGQMKLTEVHDFMRRIETSILATTGGSLPRSFKTSYEAPSDYFPEFSEPEDDDDSESVDFVLVHDATTQTSPDLSRSSSFTWVSDCDSMYASQLQYCPSNLSRNSNSNSVGGGRSCSSVDAGDGSSSLDSCDEADGDRDNNLRQAVVTLESLTEVSGGENGLESSSSDDSSMSLSESLDLINADIISSSDDDDLGARKEEADDDVGELNGESELNAGNGLERSDDKIWVRREDVDTQTASSNSMNFSDVERSADSSFVGGSLCDSATSYGDISTIKTSDSIISTTSMISITDNEGDSSMPSAVRETRSDSNIAIFRLGLSFENERSIRSEDPLTTVSTTPQSPGENRNCFTVPQQNRIRPQFLRNLSAPTSTLSSPVTEQRELPATAPIILPTQISLMNLPTLEITTKSSSAPVLDLRASKANGSGSGGSSPTASTGTSSLAGITAARIKVIPPPRSQSVKELAELEAVEACKWLRAAGFPQYAQMFEDLQFPIDIAAVQKDHYFLDADSLQSLFRRLNALNRCARMRLDSIPRKTGIDDSDEEEQCALSENWTFQRQSRRWSRIPSSLEGVPVSLGRGDHLTPPVSPKRRQMMDSQNGSSDSVFLEGVDYSNHKGRSTSSSQKSTCDDGEGLDSSVHTEEDGSSGSASLGSASTLEKHEDVTGDLGRSGSFRRSGSERLRDGARALLRRMESLKTRHSKRRNREAVVISGPHLMDAEGMHHRVQKLACIDLTPPTSTSSSPQFVHHKRSASEGRPPQNRPNLQPPPSWGDADSASLNSTSDTSQSSTPAPHPRNRYRNGSTRRWISNQKSSHRPDSEAGTFSDSECSPPLVHCSNHKDTNSNETKLIEHYLLTKDSDQIISNGYLEVGNGNHVNFRTGSFNLGSESSSYRKRFMEKQKLKHSKTLLMPPDPDGEKRGSVYDNVPVIIYNRSYDDSDPQYLAEQKNITDLRQDGTMLQEKLRLGFCQESDSGSSASTNQDASDQENQKSVENNLNNQIGESGFRLAVTRVNNVNKLQSRWRSISHKSKHVSLTTRALPINSLSAGQLMILRKLSLLKLTALMERYSPSNRSGWSWIMPKFIKRIKAPDYKDKVVFGVPLTVVQQRTGQPLPPSIQAAMRFLKKNALDSVGIFRKSGVRSRIQKLKNMNEANPDNISYEGQQTYDVADMVKQYFRELPEALLTNKMSETFISIFQHIPKELRLEATQAAIMMMPDENREVLQKLLSFLSDVSNQAQTNQMTASNLAVCFAPSLFYMNTSRNGSSSPRRHKTVGVPDQKELNENRAAHECLSNMIEDFRHLFSVPEDTMFQCRFTYIEDSVPLPLEELGRQNGANGDWQDHMNDSIHALLKDTREKVKGWISVNMPNSIELACRKVGDGSPLRMWKTVVEVEAPPVELLNRVLRERHLWDDQLLKWRVITRLDNQSEVFQYITSSMPPLPSRDFCVLRSWRTDLPKGTCVLVETSVDHPDAPMMLGGVRGVVLFARYLIEPCGSGKSRITYICRVDTRGRSPEWNNKVYGHICSLHMNRIRDSFRHNAEGPESKV